jgi:hypothetical protein
MVQASAGLRNNEPLTPQVKYLSQSSQWLPVCNGDGALVVPAKAETHRHVYGMG